MDWLIGLLVFAIVVVVVFYVLRLILGATGLPEPIPKIVLLIFGLIVLLILLQYLGVWTGGPRTFRFR
jgi:hypothetical protein